MVSILKFFSLGRFDRLPLSRFVCIACCAMMMVCACGSAYAEESAEGDNDYIIETRLAAPTHSVEDARHPSGFVTRISAADLFAQARGLADALGQVPGVHVSHQSSFGQSAFARVRGGNSRQMVVLLDGMRLSAPVGMGFDIGQLALDGIDSVDVYRGSVASVHGAGALTGAMNLRTRNTSQELWESSATLLTGSFATHGIAGHAKLVQSDYGLHLNASWRKSEGSFGFVDEQGVDHQRINNDHFRLNLLGGGHINLSDNHVVKATLMWDRGESGNAGPGEFQQRFARARTDDERILGALHWEKNNAWQSDHAALDLNAHIGGQLRHTNYVNPEAFLSRDAFEQSSSLRTLSSALRATNYLSPNDLSFGNFTHMEVEARLEDYTSHTHSLVQPKLQADRLTLAAALSNELLLASDAVSLIGGLRTEWIRDDQFATTALLPSAGLIWRTLSWLSVNGNVAKTFRAPDFDELYLQTETLRGRQDLDPEKALIWDAGFTIGREKGLLSTQIVYFQNHIDNMILFLPVSAYVFEARNLEGAFSSGIETSLQFNAHQRFQASATYTLTGASLNLMPDVQLPHQPRHRATLQTEWQLGQMKPWEKLRTLKLHTSTHYRSTIYFDQFGNLNNPPALTMDAALSTALSSWLHLRFDAHNIFNHRQAQDSLQRPLPGRAIYMSLRFEHSKGL